MAGLLVRQVLGEDLGEGHPEPVGDPRQPVAAGRAILEVGGVVGIVDGLVAGQPPGQVEAGDDEQGNAGQEGDPQCPGPLVT